MILLPQKVAYRGTLTGLRISAVDGTAFIDACAALVPYADGSHLIEIYDASGRMLRGYLGAAGTGETLGAEIITDPDFDNAGLWTPQAGWSVAGGLASSVGGNSGMHCYMTKSRTLGALYKGVAIISSYTSGSWDVFIAGVDGSTSYQNADVTKYHTGTAAGTAGYGLRSASNFIGAIASVSIKQVLTPDTSGATIVSAAGGATENFAYKDASFNYNEASYYCLIRKAR